MKAEFKVESGWRTWLRSGYWYRVTVLEPRATIDRIRYHEPRTHHNRLYCYHEVWRNQMLVYHPHVDHLQPRIREWLLASVPWGQWRSERPAGRELDGIGFQHLRHVILFKMAWAGRL